MKVTDEIKLVVFDWLLMGVICLIALASSLIDPYEQVIPPNDPSLSYEFKSTDIVPSWCLPIFWILALASVTIIIGLKDKRKLEKHVRCLFIGVSLNFYFTRILKIAVGRLRPDFLDRCDIDAGHCSGDGKHIREGRKSFPSGHSSHAFASFLFIALVLGEHWKMWNQNKKCVTRFWKVFVWSFPIFLAFLISVTRFLDNRHHVTDILAGILLGSACAYLGFSQRENTSVKGTAEEIEE